MTGQYNITQQHVVRQTTSRASASGQDQLALLVHGTGTEYARPGVAIGLTERGSLAGGAHGQAEAGGRLALTALLHVDNALHVSEYMTVKELR